MKRRQQKTSNHNQREMETFEKEACEQFAQKEATVKHQVERRGHQGESEIESVRKAQIEAEILEKERLEQLERQRNENGKELAVLEEQFTQEKKRADEQVRKRLDQRKVKGQQKEAAARAAEEEARKERERINLEYEDKKRRLEEEQMKKEAERKRELEAKAAQEVEEANRKQVEALTNLEKLREAQQLETQALQAEMASSSHAADDRYLD
jgi:dTMP kinase